MLTRTIAAALAPLLLQATAVPTPSRPGGLPCNGAACSFDPLATGIGRPAGIFVGADNSLYLASPDTKRVFRIDGSRMTVAAGGGGPIVDPRMSPIGDGSPAGNALLSAPVALAVDAAGNLYVGDDGDGLVRRIDARTGVITTVLGSPPDPMPPPPSDAARRIAPSASPGTGQPRRFRPGGMAFDRAGNLYLSEIATHTVLRVRLPGGLVDAVAGSGLPGYSGNGGLAKHARLSSPEGLAFDPSGDLLIADSGNHCVRKVDSRSGVITTVAGDGFAGDAGDGGNASSSQLSHPVAVAVDGEGDVFIADLGNKRVRRIERRTGRISTVQGLENMACGAIAVDRDGALLATDVVRWTVMRRNGGGGLAVIAGNGGVGFTGDGGPARSAYLSRPHGLARDTEGNLYVAETSANRVRRVDRTGRISTVAGSGRTGFAGDGGPAKEAAFAGPQGLAIDREQRLVIADTGNHCVRRVEHDGRVVTIAGNGTDGLPADGDPVLTASIGRPTAVAVDAEGALIVVQGPYGLIHRVDAAGTLRTIVGRTKGVSLREGDAATSGRAGRISAFALGPEGQILFADEDSMRLWGVDPRSGTVRAVAGRGLAAPHAPAGQAEGVTLGTLDALASDGSNNLYVGSFARGIRRIDAAPPHDVQPLGAEQPRLVPTGLLAVGLGTVYVADGRGYVWRLGPENQLEVVAGGGFGF